jgi:hypothetical protein
MIGCNKNLDSTIQNLEIFMAENNNDELIF